MTVEFTRPEVDLDAPAAGPLDGTTPVIIGGAYVVNDMNEPVGVAGTQCDALSDD